MSLTTSNCQQICTSPTNNSKAKMLYSFSKSTRFSRKKRFYCDNFYNITSKNQARSTSLGFGKKYDFTKQLPNSPPPTSYNIKSEFQVNVNKGTAFGEGRQQMSITGPFVGTKRNKNPGPGAYSSKTTLNKLSYSINGKNIKEDQEKKKLPGPGTYQSLFNISEKGKYFSAKHKNSCVRNFNSSIKRQTSYQNIVPGPGKYANGKTEFSPEGRYTLSRMENPYVRSFGTSKRKALNYNSITPGPGNYRIPSQFGYYIAKTAPGCDRQKILPRVSNKENQQVS